MAHLQTKQALLIIYPQIEFRPKSWKQPFAHTLSAEEIEDAVGSFRQFPVLAMELTEGRVQIESEIVSAERSLTTLTQMGPEQYWPSPDDTRLELDTFAPPGRYDSVFVLWPQNNFASGRSLPSGGWGLAIAAGAWSNWAIYATVANARSTTWQVPKIGEVWLHEWLHGVCSFYADLGYPMPAGDADGGDRHGYKQSPALGWTEYYRDLMTGNVLEGGRRVGIPLEAWSASRCAKR